MKITDSSGNTYRLSATQVYWMSGLAWAFFIISWISNVFNYSIHPSSVEIFTKSQIKSLYIWGVNVLESSRDGNDVCSFYKFII